MAVVDPIKCHGIDVFKYDVFLYQCAIVVLYLINQSIKYNYGAKLRFFLDISSFFAQLIKKSTSLVQK